MHVDLWGFEGGFSLGLPLQPWGYGVLAMYIVALAGLLLANRRGAASDKARSAAGGGALLAGLLLIAPLASEFLLLHLPAPGALAAPGAPRKASGPAFSLLGALPWLMAGGMLGEWQAALVGLAAGLARGGWTTLNVLTPLHVALQAALTAWLVRRDYAEWPGTLARSPLASSLMVGTAFGLLGVAELFAGSGGTAVDALEYALSRLTPTVLAAVLEAGSAGAIAEALRIIKPALWYQPRRLSPGPYNRSLAGRMLTVFVCLGALAGGVTLYGDWLLARASARELVESRMTQTASLTGGGIPYFIQAGRGLITQTADELSSGTPSPEALDQRMREMPFFSRLAVFDDSGQLVTQAPAPDPAEGDLLAEIAPSLAVALAGVPQELVVSPRAASLGARLVFLAPIQPAEASAPQGAVAGWTDLASNPILAPLVARLAAVSDGEAFVTDERGVIVIDPDPRRLMQTVELEPPGGGVYADAAPDGTRRLVYAYAVPGYPWRVVITTPQRAVDTLALRIAARLFAVIVAVGLVMMGVVYASSRRLTRPLGLMAEAAESIAHGNLAQPVGGTGEDEIGRLAVAFEGMRRSLHARLGEMDLLLAASRQMASSFELKRVLPPILAGVQKLVRADLVHLVMAPAPGGETGRLEIYQAGRDPGDWSSLDGQVLELCRERGGFALDNPARARAILNLQALTEPVAGLMGVPMRHEDEFVGVIWLGHRKPHAFNPEEVNLLSILAGQLAMSVANASLFQRAEQERMRLRAVLEATPDAVLVTDKAGRISLANPAAEAVLRGPADEALGQPASERLASPEVLELLRSTAGPRTAEVRLEGGRVLFATAADIYPAGREPSGRVCVLWDVTHFKKLDTLKSEFVSTVSHDLRAPLTLMRGYATMLSMVGAMNEQQKDFVRKIYDSVEQMTKLVDNLLDLGRIEAGVGLDLQAVVVGDLVHEVAGIYQPQALNKQISLQVTIDPGERPIQADGALLRQAIANLVDNAIKYTLPGGRVALRTRQHDGRQMVSVEDSGVGIAPTDQARLFEKFYRARRSETVREKGAGLGLAIVRSIAEQHGGRVSVESRLGVGSTFTLEVPARLVAAN